MHHPPLNVGIIGIGRIGAEHAESLAQIDETRVLRVFDPTPARRVRAEQLGFATCDDAAGVLGDDSIEAVLIATPTSMHSEQVLAALDAGKHVMVEKPMALDLAQSRRMVDRAAAGGRVLSVFHNRRWDLDYLTVRRAIESDLFGRVFNIESRLHQWGSCVGPAAREWRPNWRNERAFGGGGLYDWGSHFVDQMIRLIPQQPTAVFAQLRGNIWSTDCDDFARVVINFDGGCVGLVEINTTTTHPGPRWHIDGTLGSAESATNPDFDVQAWAKLLFRPGTATPGASDLSQMLPLATDVLSPIDIWRQFAAACRGEREPAVPAVSVLPTMAVLDAARQSSRSGCAVSLGDRAEWRS